MISLRGFETLSVPTCNREQFRGNVRPRGGGGGKRSGPVGPHRYNRRAGRGAPGHVVPVLAAERAVDRRTRHALRGRLRERLDRAGAPGVVARHPHRQRARRQGGVLHSRSGRRRAEHECGGGRGGGPERGDLRRRGRAAGIEAVRPLGATPGRPRHAFCGEPVARSSATGRRTIPAMMAKTGPSTRLSLGWSGLASEVAEDVRSADDERVGNYEKWRHEPRQLRHRLKARANPASRRCGAHAPVESDRIRHSG
jgi:hypothetical protein